MTKINDTVSLLSAGWTNANAYSAQTWYYNHDTEAFTSGPDLLEGRRFHSSAMNVDKVTKAKIPDEVKEVNSNLCKQKQFIKSVQFKSVLQTDCLPKPTCCFC